MRSKRIAPVPEYGLCPTHHQISVDDLLEGKKEHPEAEVVVQPECIMEIQEMADQVASTSGMVRYCKESGAEEFLIGTEVGLIYRLRTEISHKEFYPLSDSAVCPQMKMHTLEKIEKVFETERFQVKVTKNTAERAIVPIERMLEHS